MGEPTRQQLRRWKRLAETIAAKAATLTGEIDQLGDDHCLHPHAVCLVTETDSFVQALDGELSDRATPEASRP